MTMNTAPDRPAWSRRPTFAPHQLLDAARLNQGFEDALVRQRLLNRALHGHGLVYGFAVQAGAARSAPAGCVEVTCGLALDRHGRVLYWDGGHLGAQDVEGPPPGTAGPHTLLVHYAQSRHPAGTSRLCGDPNEPWVEHGVVFTLREARSREEHRCPTPDGAACVSHADYVRQRIGNLVGAFPPAADLSWACEEPGPLTPTACGTWEYDCEAGVPVGCVEVGELDADCEPRLGVCDPQPDEAAAWPRVHRTPLLYELLSCCDVDVARVSRVSWASWGDWSEEVDWWSFADRMRATTGEDGLAIWFSKPILSSTLHEASILLTAFHQEYRTDYWMMQRVPLARLDPLERATASDGTETARGVRLVPTDEWLAAEIDGDRSTLRQGSRFEVTVRGQMLRDECERMLDARPLDIECGARCQARPGGDFISPFRVAPVRDVDRRVQS